MLNEIERKRFKQLHNRIERLEALLMATVSIQVSMLVQMGQTDEQIREYYGNTLPAAELFKILGHVRDGPVEVVPEDEKPEPQVIITEDTKSSLISF